MGTRVVVTGANSAVGQAILRQCWQHAEAPTIVAAVRSERALKDLPPLPPERRALVSYDDPSSLTAAFAGAMAVIHLAGTLIERPDSTYEKANVQTSRAVADAAVKSGVRKLVLISAIGADEQSPNRYWRTKGQAEAAIRASGLAFTILRAPLLLGPRTEGTAAMLRHLGRPAATLPGGGRNWQQPLYVDDLARAALAASTPDVARDLTLHLVGPTPVREYEILERIARHVGRSIRVKSMPVPLLRAILSLRRFFAPGGFSTEVLDVITADTKMDPVPAAHALGLQLTALDDMTREGLEPAHQG
jgi:NADH dehydrogenase